MKNSKKKWALERFGVGDVVIYIILTLTAFCCVAPVWNVLMISLSHAAAATAGMVTVWPVHFTLNSYKQLIEDATFFRAFGMSVLRVILGTSMSMALMFLMAYPLSKESREFPMRNIYMWYIVITMLFSGGRVERFSSKGCFAGCP